jgi:membrane-associated phospholipid phosphatase
LYVSLTFLLHFVTGTRPVQRPERVRVAFSARKRGFRIAQAAQLAVALLLMGAEATAEPRCADVAPWSRLDRTGAELVRPLPALLALGAAVPPSVLVPTGLDHRLRLVAQEDLGGRYRLEPVSFYAPFVLAGGVLVTHVGGTIAGSCSIRRPTAAMVQAMVLGIGVTGLLKWTTGRGWPNGGRDPHAPDRLEHPEAATAFRPFRAGLGAFPSGHTLSMMVAAAAFRAAEPELGLLAWSGYPLALGVGAGMWLGDHHWASDVLSGLLLGEAIGGSVGRSFAPSDLERDEHRIGVVVLPLDGGAMASVAGAF